MYSTANSKNSPFWLPPSFTSYEDYRYSIRESIILF